MVKFIEIMEKTTPTDPTFLAEIRKSIWERIGWWLPSILIVDFASKQSHIPHFFQVLIYSIITSRQTFYIHSNPLLFSFIILGRRRNGWREWIVFWAEYRS